MPSIWKTHCHCPVGPETLCHSARQAISTPSPLRSLTKTCSCVSGRRSAHLIHAISVLSKGEIRERSVFCVSSIVTGSPGLPKIAKKSLISHSTSCFIVAIITPHTARWARSLKLLAPSEGNRLWRNPQMAHVRHVHHIRIPRVNLHGIPIPVANG